VKYSVIIPVYNRPDEVDELLASLSAQTEKDFEVIIVEDGSSVTCEQIVGKYDSSLSIRYFTKQNEGPGPARNFGFAKASGDYLVIFDSDCIIPEMYFAVVSAALAARKLDAWGGPDKPHENFTLVQRAMGYTMSSFLTTGGIRGGKKHVGWFQPRSFNMGMSKAVFGTTKGFRFTRFAEDIELSIRMKEAGYNVGLIEEAFVYHKRRANFKQFFRQVSNFGKGRVHIGNVYPAEVKITHWIPALFTLGLFALLVLGFLHKQLLILGLIGLGAYLMTLLIHSAIVNRNILVGILSVPSALIQLTGYGSGFLWEKLKGKSRGVIGGLT
jgi:glycosyltransferase involved in cell wall biosynthesis